MFESKRRAFIFMFVSIFLALTAVILFSDFISKTKESLGEMSTVLVAKGGIGAGKPITANMVAEMEIPKKYMLDSLIQSKDDLYGKISMLPIADGAVITSSVLRNNTIISGENRQVMLRAPMAVFDDQIDALDKVDLIVSYDEQPGPGKPQQEDKRTTKVLLKDVTVNQVFKKGDEITAIGVVLSLKDAKSAIWALNYSKEVRVLKIGNSKAQQDEDAKDSSAQDNGETQKQEHRQPTAKPTPADKPKAPATKPAPAKGGK